MYQTLTDIQAVFGKMVKHIKKINASLTGSFTNQGDALNIKMLPQQYEESIWIPMMNKKGFTLSSLSPRSSFERDGKTYSFYTTSGQ